MQKSLYSRRAYMRSYILFRTVQYYLRYSHVHTIDVNHMPTIHNSGSGAWHCGASFNNGNRSGFVRGDGQQSGSESKTEIEGCLCCEERELEARFLRLDGLELR